MVKSKRLEIKNGDLDGAIRDFLDHLFERELVEGLLVPQEVPSGDNVVQTLVMDREKMGGVKILAPVMPVNSSRIVSSLTKLTSSPRQVGVVMRPCELRALFELVKLKQASLENLLLIGVDCYGTYPVKEYARLSKNGESLKENYWQAIRSGKEDQNLRIVCQICEYPFPQNADIIVGLIGADLNRELWIKAGTSKGIEVLGALGSAEEEEEREREGALKEIIAKRTERRQAVFKEIQEKSQGLKKLLSLLSTCINCHNCKTACPLCYCKECFFDSSTFDWEAEKYLNWAKRGGLIRLPMDTLLFHLTRMVHMVHSCVGCGACEDACPNGIPVAQLFLSVGQEVKALFEYVPGRDLEEPIPVATFREDELQTVGEG